MTHPTPRPKLRKKKATPLAKAHARQIERAQRESFETYWEPILARLGTQIRFGYRALCEDDDVQSLLREQVLPKLLQSHLIASHAVGKTLASVRAGGDLSENPLARTEGADLAFDVVRCFSDLAHYGSVLLTLCGEDPTQNPAVVQRDGWTKGELGGLEAFERGLVGAWMAHSFFVALSGHARIQRLGLASELATQIVAILKQLYSLLLPLSSFEPPFPGAPWDLS